jgi:hypothetical protein
MTDWKVVSGVAAAVVSVATGFVGFLKWFRTKRNERKERRRVEDEKKLGGMILDALQDSSLWPKHGITGGGYSCVRAAELAVHLGKERDEVADCLELLQTQGRVKKSSGSLSDPSPTWFFVPR